MKLASRYLASLALILALFGCQEKFTADRPRVYTKPTGNIVADQGATFVGFIDNTSKSAIINHGFEWSYTLTKPGLASGTLYTFRIDLGGFDGGSYSSEIRSALPKDIEVSVRAFAKVNGFIIYGEEIYFTGEGSEGPMVTGISPLTVSPGDTLVVSGKNLTSTPQISFVLGPNFSDCNLIESNNSVAKVIVPSDIRDTQYAIRIKLANQTISPPEHVQVVFDEWKALNNFPGFQRTGAFSFSYGSKGFVGTGLKESPAGSFVLSDFWEYDQSTDHWTQLPNFPGAGRYDASCFVIGNKAYVGLGRVDGSTAFNDFWEYDLLLGTWTRKADYAGGSRTSSIAFAIGSTGYFGGGAITNGTLVSDFWAYDPIGNTWTPKASIPFKVVNHGISFTYNSLGYYVADFGSVGGKLPLCAYNSTSDTWTYAPFEPNSSYGSAVQIGSDIYAFGYYNMYKITPGQAAKQLRTTNLYSFPTFCFSINNKAYVGYQSVLEFDPSKL